ncbi:MAG TPA: hypothetical protein DEP53_07065 [Bacteroidetes bacterium]|nr:hypothetical protein [Bacteroidota bacterium]
MIQCPVCRVENDDFAITCSQCKGFIQDRVPNLNLFETGWTVLESPHKAFRTITLAEHKNYVLFLFTLFGISLSFTGFWLFRLGRYFENLLDLIGSALGAGIVLGLASAAILTLAYHGMAKLFGGKSGFRSSLGLLGYSLTPIALTLFVILPIELLTFGMYMFTGNPHPYTIKPVSYVILVGFDSVIAVWSVVLAVLGTRVGHQMSIGKSILVVLGTMALFGGALYVAADQFHIDGKL